MEKNEFNLIVSLASLVRPENVSKNKLILDRLCSKKEGYINDNYYRYESNIINDVVGSCIYYEDYIDYKILDTNANFINFVAIYICIQLYRVIIIN